MPLESLELTVLDQSPLLATGSTTAKRGAGGPALTVELARAADLWGYKRYWVAEHHNSGNYAGSCPEILIGHIASQTQNLRVGSAGVMLTHYSPFKVAEQFSMLSTLYPGRIDLGIGRAPGGDGLATQALAFPHAPSNSDTYPVQARLLKGFVENKLPADNPFRELVVSPDDGLRPELWMLGSSGGSAALAGALGYNMALALFIGPQERAVSIIDDYEAAWRDAGHSGDPQVMIVNACFCAESREEARFIAATHAYWKVGIFRHGLREPFYSPQQAMDGYKKLSPSDQEYFDITLESGVYGTASGCLDQLQQLKVKYRASELGIVTVTYDQASRLKSYQLLAGK